MIKSAVRWTLAMGCLAVAPLCLHAQEGDKPWKFSVEGRVRATDNRDGSKTNKESDVDTILSPRADVFRRTEETLFDLYYAPSLLWRSNPRDDQNDFDVYHSLGLTVSHRLGPTTRLSAGEFFDYTDDPQVTQGDAVVRQNASYYMNRVNAGVEQMLGPRVTAEASGNYTIKRYQEQSLSDSSDEDQTGADAKLKYLFTRTFDAFIGGQYAGAQFKGIERKSTILTAYGGLDRALGPQMSASVSAGYSKSDEKEAIDTSSTSPYFAASLRMNASSSTRFDLNASYALAAGDYGTYTVQKRTSVGLGVTQDLGRNLSLYANGTYVNGEYESDATVTGTTAINGHDSLYDAHVGATYRLTRKLSTGADYEYQDWQSDIRDPFTANIVGAFVKWEF